MYTHSYNRHLHIDLFFYILEGVVNIPCTTTPPAPANITTFPISDSQVIIAWDKPVGSGYTYLMYYSNYYAIRETEVSGNEGFGTMHIIVLSSLESKSKYKASIKHICAQNRNLKSPYVDITFDAPNHGLFFIKTSTFDAVKTSLFSQWKRMYLCLVLQHML